MSDEIDRVIGRLRAGESLVDDPTAEQWERAGRIADLKKLWAAIESACDAEGAARGPYEAFVDRIEEALALAEGDDRIDAVLELGARPRSRSVVHVRTPETRARALASRLAYGQTKEGFVAAIERYGTRAELREILACWAQEIVLRGTTLDRESAVLDFQEALTSTKHPLASLPLGLLPTEREAPTYMPLYGSHAVEQAVERLQSGATSTRTLPPVHTELAAGVRRVEDADVEKRIATALTPWTERSKGRVEARVFEAPVTLMPGNLGKSLLRMLPLACIEDVTSLSADRVGVEAVWGALFAAASNGGAYSSGFGGAYGRPAAWRSLGALVGLPGDASISEIEAQASRCPCLIFQASGPWFHSIAWDIGAVVLRPEGKTFAVVAATDTD